MAFVREARGAAVQQTGNDAFDHRPAIATGTGEVHLGGGAPFVQTCRVQEPPDVLLRRSRGERLDRVRDAHDENAPYMQRLAQLCIVQGQITDQGVDGRRGAPGDLSQGVLHFVDQGQNIAGITGISHRQMKSENEARGRLGDNAWFAAKLCRAVALAFANGGKGKIVRIDDFALGQGFAMGEAAGLCSDLVVGRNGRFELGVPTLTLALSQMRRALHTRLRRLSKRHDLVPGRKQLLFRLAHQGHKHLALAAALASEAAHNLLEIVLELTRVGLQCRSRGSAPIGHMLDDLEDFFLALYRVAASLTRWLPCSLGKVSTTRWAGLTSPSSIAVAAWIASNSAINGSSSRRRNWASTSGSTKCSWARSTRTSVIPQAYITATSVRNRLQICSSEQVNSCFSNSNANNTRVETGGRPRVLGLGKRWANERSTAATRAAHGNVSAHWRMGCVSGTKSAT